MPYSQLDLRASAHVTLWHYSTHDDLVDFVIGSKETEMAHNPRDLSVLAYANGFTLWHYRTTDDLAEIVSGGYFNIAADRLRDGDMIMVNYDVDETPSAGIFLVTRRSDGVVEVRSMTRVGADE